ncbi:MAG: hypothetical protein ACU0GG_10245 [Paracoccaceae bacterium]
MTALDLKYSGAQTAFGENPLLFKEQDAALIAFSTSDMGDFKACRLLAVGIAPREVWAVLQVFCTEITKDGGEHLLRCASQVGTHFIIAIIGRDQDQHTVQLIDYIDRQ